eukprot:9482837-Pyramimonas_sp.AAC.2
MSKDEHAGSKSCNYAVEPTLLDVADMAHLSRRLRLACTRYRSSGCARVHAGTPAYRTVPETHEQCKPRLTLERCFCPCDARVKTLLFGERVLDRP